MACGKAESAPPPVPGGQKRGTRLIAEWNDALLDANCEKPSKLH
jgi:hypothetical protein